MKDKFDIIITLSQLLYIYTKAMKLFWSLMLWAPHDDEEKQGNKIRTNRL